MSDNAQTTITDWRIIGVSGATADGRKISAEHLNQMAESYNRSIYGARINLEHIRFFLPDYAGYGDVLELKTAPWPADNDKTCLLARLSVLPALNLPTPAKPTSSASPLPTTPPASAQPPTTPQGAHWPTPEKSDSPPTAKAKP